MLEFQKCTVSINGGEYSSLVDNMGHFNVQVPGPGTYIKLDGHSTILNRDKAFTKSFGFAN